MSAVYTECLDALHEVQREIGLGAVRSGRRPGSQTVAFVIEGHEADLRGPRVGPAAGALGWGPRLGEPRLGWAGAPAGEADGYGLKNAQAIGRSIAPSYGGEKFVTLFVGTIRP